MSKPLDGKVALVTGASRGIGRAIATALAADGAVVGVHYGKSRAEADKVVADIKAKGGDAFAVGADLTKANAADTLFTAFDAEVSKRKGTAKFDILVNNAGIAPFGDVAGTTEALLDELFAVNVKAPLLVTQKALSRLNDGGRIVSTSSAVVRVPVPGLAAYSALKAAINNLTRTLAVDLGPRNITVNAVAPGVIETDMAAGILTAESQSHILGKQALKRVGQADDIADVVAFLAGPKSRWITGETIEVSGGTALTF